MFKIQNKYLRKTSTEKNKLEWEYIYIVAELEQDPLWHAA